MEHIKLMQVGTNLNVVITEEGKEPKTYTKSLKDKVERDALKSQIQTAITKVSNSESKKVISKIKTDLIKLLTPKTEEAKKEVEKEIIKKKADKKLVKKEVKTAKKATSVKNQAFESLKTAIDKGGLTDAEQKELRELLDKNKKVETPKASEGKRSGGRESYR